MTRDFDDLFRDVISDEGRRATMAAPSIEEAVGRLAPRLGSRRGGDQRRMVVLLAAALLMVGLAASAIGVGAGVLRIPIVVDTATHAEEPTVDLGIFDPVAGRIVYASGASMRAVDPSGASDETTVQLTSPGGTPLGWSRDGTVLLITRQGLAPRGLFVLHADGSETQLSEEPISVRDAAISLDGRRVVFKGSGIGLSVVDADGGSAELPVEGTVEGLTISPDGTQIAYVTGAGDHSHHVWVMDADGSDAHEIVFNEWTAAASHVYGLAWSPAGDRIALGLEGRIYTFAPDGSDFTLVIRNGDNPYWSPDGSRLAYTTFSSSRCLEQCRLGIADSDGSNVRTFDVGASGPWHPGTVEGNAGD